MKTEFTKLEVLKNCGCYSQEQANSFINELQEPISIETLLNLPISIEDKRWFVYNSCNLLLNEKKELAIRMAWCVLSIYENKYPNDLRVRNYLIAIEEYNKGNISMKELIVAKNAADAAADAADAAADAADAAADAAYAADAADAAYAAYAAYAAVHAAAAAADKLTYSQQLLQILIDFVK
jgi:hypothetical protein